METSVLGRFERSAAAGGGGGTANKRPAAPTDVAP